MIVFRLLMYGALISLGGIAYQKISSEAACVPEPGTGATVWLDYLPKP